MVVEEPDGRVSLTVTAYHDIEIIQRVLRLGAEAEILSPAHCREEIKKTITGMARLYQ